MITPKSVVGCALPLLGVHLLALGLWPEAASGAPVAWAGVPETYTLAAGAVVADSAGRECDDHYLLSEADYSDFILEWDQTRLRAAPDPGRERAIVVWGLDRQKPDNRRSYFLCNWLPAVGRSVHALLVVRQGQAHLYLDGQLVAVGNSTDYGTPPARGAVGFLHYFSYAYRYENIRISDLTAGDAPVLPAPTVDVQSSGAVRVSWQLPAGLQTIGQVEVCRGDEARLLATVRGSEYLDRDTRPGQPLTYRVRLRLDGGEAGALSAASAGRIERVQPPAPATALRATGRLDGSIRVDWKLAPDSRAGEIVVLGSDRRLRRAGAAGSRELARVAASAPGSLVVPGPQAWIGLLVSDPAGGKGALSSVQVQPHAPLLPGGPSLPEQHPCLLYSAADLAKVRADRGPERQQLIGSYRRNAAGLLAQKTVIPGKVQSSGEASAGESQGHFTMASNCQALGYAYALSGDERYAAKVREILLGYADVYLSYPVTAGRCRAMSASGLWESIWYVRLLMGYDLTYDSPVYAAADRQHLERDLLRPAVALFVVPDHGDRRDPRVGDLHYRCYNFEAWFDAAVGLTGLLLRDPDLFEYAIDSTYGLKHLIAHDLYDDGLFWERSIGYHGFVREALTPLLEAAWHHGYDLYHLEVPDVLQEPIPPHCFMDGDHGPKSLKLLWEAPFYLQFADGRFPVVGDSGPGPLAADDTTWVGWARYGDPRLLWLLQKGPSAPSEAPADRDLSGSVRLAWDEQYLYVLAEVMDDVVRNTQDDAALAYSGDAVWLGLRYSDPQLDRYDAIYGLTPGDFDKHLPYAALFNRAGAPWNQRSAGRVAARRTPEGYVLEAALPLAELAPRAGDAAFAPLTPRPGLEITADVCLYDGDARTGASVRDTVAAWSATSNRYDPAQGGRLRFVEAGGAPPAGNDTGPKTAVVPRLGAPLEPAANPAAWAAVPATPIRIDTSSHRLSDAASSGGLAGAVFGPLPQPPVPFVIGSGSFAKIGRNQHGSSLFPSAGFAVLRQDAADPRSMGLCLSYGPFGGGHGHPDKLSIVLHGLGGEPITDFGSCSYASPLKSTWTHQTVAHNTMVVDGHSQALDTTGTLGFFQADAVMRTAQAAADGLYPGVHCERTVVMVGPLVIDIYRAVSEEGHIYDYVLHLDGDLQESTDSPAPRAEPLGRECGYQHLEDVCSVSAAGDWRGVWVGPKARLATTLLSGEPTEICSARSLTNSPDAKMALLLARRQASTTTYAMVLDTYTDQPHATSVQRLGPQAVSLLLDGEPVYVMWGASTPTVAGPLTAQAALAVVWERGDGVQASAVNGKRITFKGKKVWPR